MTDPASARVRRVAVGVPQPRRCSGKKQSQESGEEQRRRAMESGATASIHECRIQTSNPLSILPMKEPPPWECAVRSEISLPNRPHRAAGRTYRGG